MSARTINCPACAVALKLPPRPVSGQQVRCPACGHRFLFEEPADVVLELADSTGPKHRPDDSAPMTGTSPRWVPDVIRSPEESAGVSESVVPPGEFCFGLPDSDGRSDRRRPRGTARHGTARSRSSLRLSLSPKSLAAGGIVLLGVIVAGGILVRAIAPRVPAAVPLAPKMNEAWRAQQVLQSESNLKSAALSPTDGEPIPLNYLPFTPQLVLHLHPAELWQPDALFPALEKLPGSPVSWLRQQIRHVTTFAPDDIAELTLTLNFGPRTTDPDVAAVVRLVRPRPITELQRQLGKLRHDITEAEIRENGSLSYLMIDPGTFVVASSSAAEALVAARDYPPLPPANLEALLAESDRTRHLTLLTDLKTIDVHREFILGQSLLQVSDQLITWMGSESETILWSFHLRPNFFMETLVHPTTDSTAQRIRRTLQLQLNQLPERMLTATRQMRPATTGSRQLVGRFPAMLRALSRATSVDVHPQYVRLISHLPASAAGNLAAASLLTWQETISGPIGPSGPIETAPALPGTIAERLSLPVLVDFRNLPLQEAMSYLGECIGTEVVIDGDALKSAGLTQNMAQTFDLGQVPARQAFGVILQRYAAERDPLVISLDEPGKRILLTTRSAAADARLVIFDMKPLNP